MSTDPSPAAGKLSPAWHRWSLVVPLLAALSLALLAARLTFGGDTFQDCHYLGPSTRMYVTAWAAPACGVLALLLLAGLSRGIRSRGGRLTMGWQGRVAAVAACVTPVLLLAQLAFLYWTLAPDPAGGTGCSGAALLTL
ncbi:hypothetical protein [Streptomyces sp. NPDC051569]|uniref:hypothetical protein n=1 Tax=Streptomyces sp. NPDC051569 TaxID=3365661 RepID=UPI00378B864E